LGLGGLSLLEGGILCACSGAAAFAGDEGDAGSSDAGTPFSTESPSAGTEELLSFRAFLFDTYVEVTALCEQETLDALDARLRFFEEKLSRTREGSDVYRINAAGGEAVEVAPETAALIERALGFCAQSNGLFDITIGAASGLWDFKQERVPAAEALAEAVKHIDYRLVEVSGSSVRLLDAAAALDLGGIAKGAIADDIAGLLREAGVGSALINLGGNVYALGTKPGGDPWNIGIQSPFAARGTLIASLPACDLSVVTSGPYERGFEKDGRLYHHLLDPKTGFPVATDLAGVTILSEGSTEGDVLSTTSFLLGHEAAFKMLAARKDLQALLIDNEGEATLVGGAEVRFV
jgi:thiamine biosynthesis lipoprotein